MPIDPFLEAVNAALPSFLDRAEDSPPSGPLTSKRSTRWPTTWPSRGPQVKDRLYISVPVDNDTIDVVIYQPFGDGPHPAHVYLHGGGWVSGTIKNKVVDIICRERCASANCVVTALEWPKAPEHKFPTPLNHSYAALLWLVEHATELGIRPDLITIGGGSSGANLAAGITLKIRDHGGPALALPDAPTPRWRCGWARTGFATPARTPSRAARCSPSAAPSRVPVWWRSRSARRCGSC